LIYFCDLIKKVLLLLIQSQTGVEPLNFEKLKSPSLYIRFQNLAAPINFQSEKYPPTINPISENSWTKLFLKHKTLLTTNPVLQGYLQKQNAEMPVIFHRQHFCIDSGHKKTDGILMLESHPIPVAGRHSPLLPASTGIQFGG